jgi:hypothetical protein
MQWLSSDEETAPRPLCQGFLLEATTGIEPVYRVLQTRA